MLGIWFFFWCTNLHAINNEKTRSQQIYNNFSSAKFIRFYFFISLPNFWNNNIWMILLEELPTTGTKRSAIKREDVKTQINVMGKYFINSPASPGQKIRGIKAARVVAVEAIIGRAIFFEAKV